MPNYARIAANAAKTIKANGVAIVLTKATPDDYDPATGTRDDLGSTDFTGAAVRDTYSAKEIDGTRIREGDARLYLALDDPTAAPEIGDALTIDGETGWAIAGPVTRIQPGSVVIVYDIQARKR
jgi:hypothetical protein